MLAKPARQAPGRIPAILLEGDEPVSKPDESQGATLASATKTLPNSPETKIGPAEAEGNGQVFLIARDPSWLYAHWNLTHDQQRYYNSIAADGHLTLRIYIDAVSLPPIEEIPLHPESRDWFVHVQRAGTTYLAELGCHAADGEWRSLCTSSPVATPPGRACEDTSAQFVTIPFDLSLTKLASRSTRSEEAKAGESSAWSREELPEEGSRELAALPSPPPHPQWTAEQSRAVAELSQPRHREGQNLASFGIAAERPAQSMPELVSFSSANPGAPESSITRSFAGSPSLSREPVPPGGFWFAVGADLIVHGATEPGASVTIAGHPIPLRSDGSFSCRFSLPDGHFDLSVVAVSEEKGEERGTTLKFSRSTEPHPTAQAPPHG